MTEKYLKVEGHSDIIRDTSTQAIINTNTDALKKAKESKNSRLNEKQKLSNLENRVDALDDKLNLILELLRKE